MGEKLSGAKEAVEEVAKIKVPEPKTTPADEVKPAENAPQLSAEVCEAILGAFIEIFKAEHEVDVDALIKRAGKPRTVIMGRALTDVFDRKEIDAFLAHLEKGGEIEKVGLVKYVENVAKEKYEFTDVGLDKYADRLFWYRAFGLMLNPFVTFEARIEKGGNIITARMFNRIEALISAKSSAIIEGERGCGKSSVIHWFRIDGPDVVTAISPRNVEGINRAIRSRVELKLGRDGNRIIKDVIVMGNPRSGEDQIKYRRAVAEVGRGGHLFDVPDNFSPKAAFKLADLCARILDEGGFIILFATLEQARLLKRLDTFARFPVIKFERPDDYFFYDLFLARIEQVVSREWGPPFRREVVTKIAKIADHNPRRFILLCNRILTEMRERRMDKPLDEKAVDELLKGADVLVEAPVDIEEALGKIMREAGAGGAKWVKVKDIRAILLERYGIDLRPETIGRRLSGMGYPKRYSPDAEYLAGGQP